jgi:hypothetical protein
MVRVYSMSYSAICNRKHADKRKAQNKRWKKTPKGRAYQRRCLYRWRSRHHAKLREINNRSRNKWRRAHPSEYAWQMRDLRDKQDARLSSLVKRPIDELETIVGQGRNKWLKLAKHAVKRTRRVALLGHDKRPIRPYKHRERPKPRGKLTAA